MNDLINILNFVLDSVWQVGPAFLVGLPKTGVVIAEIPEFERRLVRRQLAHGTGIAVADDGVVHDVAVDVFHAGIVGLDVARTPIDLGIL